MNNNPSLIIKIIKIQAIIRGRLVRKILSNKGKESDSYRYNFKDNNSDIHSINIGSDIPNGGGLISNGANSIIYNNRNINTPFKQITTESEDKQKSFLQNIVK